MPCRIAAAGVLLSTLLTTSARGSDALLELDVDGDAYVGKSLAHDQETCWLLSPDGRLHVLEANANPELSYGDDFAESAESAGISYRKLLQRIISLGLSYRAAWRG